MSLFRGVNWIIVVSWWWLYTFDFAGIGFDKHCIEAVRTTSAKIVISCSTAPKITFSFTRGNDLAAQTVTFMLNNDISALANWFHD